MARVRALLLVPAIVLALSAAACGESRGIHAGLVAAAQPKPTLSLQVDPGDEPLTAASEKGLPSIAGNSLVVVVGKSGPATPAGRLFSAVMGVTHGNGPIYVCPVQGPFRFFDDFGAPRCVSNSPSCGGFHHHQGNDIMSALGTPIVAPFPGVARDASNLVGGNAVAVFGKDGYVYNAHLVAFGHLGQVRTGTVIGFVGNTGDAAGGATHDHFEWHPNDGSAVDPYPFLKEACT